DDIWAVGGTRLQEKSGEVSAETLYYNVRRKDFRLENGTVFLYKQPVIMTGESITRYGEDMYEGNNIQYTPCLGEPPAWSLKTSRFNAPVEKYGNASGVRFQVREFPVVYVPYLIFPVKLQRQSGFLAPAVGTSSDYGTRLGLPYYRVLGRSADATITPNYLSERGLLMAGEFRYRLDEERQGELYAESLIDDRKGGEELTGGVLDTIPDSRWLFRSSQTGGNLTWDVKLVSNPDYFRDIGSVYGTETPWRDTLAADQGRSIEELVSRGQWNSAMKGFTMNVSGLWKQDLIVPSNSKTFQELPRVSVRMTQKNIPGTPVYVSSEINSVNIYSIDWTRAIKDTAQVQLSMPLSFFPYFTLTPSYTQFYRDAHITSNPEEFQSDEIRQRWEAEDATITSLYDSNFFSDNPGVLDKDNYYELWERRDVTMNTTLYSRRFLDGLYHQMVPSVSWTYLSRVGGNYDPGDPDDFFPEFLPEDEWAKENYIKVSLENYIRNRSGQPLYEVSLSRIYDYLLREWDYYEANLVAQPVPWFTARHLNRFRSADYPTATIEHWTHLSLKDSRGDELYGSEEYNRLDTTTARIGVKANLVRGFSARTEFNYDFRQDRFNDFLTAVTYTSQCWSLTVYRDVEQSDIYAPRDTTVGVTVNLLGLGDVVRTRRTVSGSDT
ncbi:MAG TPA: LPS assembly protein LptD, partial [Deltaproteobacteria bacterium]|nr:LPS assembly protein LptD [Deltaproteobacteria bacterium]